MVGETVRGPDRRHHRFGVWDTLQSCRRPSKIEGNIKAALAVIDTADSPAVSNLKSILRLSRR